MAERRIIPVFLAGGGGARLWPLSQGDKPKQFLALAGDRTLFQQAIERAADAALFDRPVIVGGARHAQAFADQLGGVGREADLVLEPFGRDTAPAVTAGLLEARRRDPRALALIMPTDHAVGDIPAFLEVVRRAAAGAEAGRIVLFGIRPDRPATGYGYIRPDPGAGVRPVAAFEEKPDADRAARLIEEGCLWNSGMFLMPVEATLSEVEWLAPAVFEAASLAWSRGGRTGHSLHLDPDAFAAAPSISIDRAVMEKTDAISVVEADMAWADLGTWSSLWSAGPRDEADNLLIGDATTRDCHGVLVRAEGLTVVTIGVEDLIVVATPEGVLVSRRGRDEEIKTVLAGRGASA